MTNESFSFEINYQKYIARMQKDSSSKLINRFNEKEVYLKLHRNPLIEEVVCFDVNEDIFHPLHGFKISKWLENANMIQKNNNKHVYLAIKEYRKLHDAKIDVSFEFDILSVLDYYIEIIGKKYQRFSKQLLKNEKKIRKILTILNSKNYTKSLCHVDSTL